MRELSVLILNELTLIIGQAACSYTDILNVHVHAVLI